MNKSLFVTLFLVLSTQVLSQQCLNQNGQPVDWYVMLILPNTVGTGYLYFDNTYTSAQFTRYVQEPDTPNTPSYNTLLQINTLSPNYLVWNDELPNGTTSSSKAHSKSLIIYNPTTFAGYTIIHSMPQYPAFIGNQVNITIGSSEQIYGQHFMCMNTNANMTHTLLNKTVIMKPYYYASNLAAYPTFTSTNLFEYANYTYGTNNVRFIFKNMKYNSSIFEDGLNNLLNSRIVAETWGRPIDAPWCGTPNTGNANTIMFSPTCQWTQTQDHSKWAYAVDNNFSCFGDMNRMSSQWSRGGAFYCIDSVLLNLALKALVPAPVTC